MLAETTATSFSFRNSTDVEGFYEKSRGMFIGVFIGSAPFLIIVFLWILVSSCSSNIIRYYHRIKQYRRTRRLGSARPISNVWIGKVTELFVFSCWFSSKKRDEVLQDELLPLDSPVEEKGLSRFQLQIGFLFFFARNRMQIILICFSTDRTAKNVNNDRIIASTENNRSIDKSMSFCEWQLSTSSFFVDESTDQIFKFDISYSQFIRLDELRSNAVHFSRTSNDDLRSPSILRCELDHLLSLFNLGRSSLVAWNDRTEMQRSSCFDDIE